MKENKKKAVNYEGMIDITKKIYRNEGVPAFYKGLTPNLLKVFPSSGLFFLAYEGTIMLLSPKSDID